MAEQSDSNEIPAECKEQAQYCKVGMDSFVNLKESTKKLLRMIEEIERKTITNNTVKNAFAGDTLKYVPIQYVLKSSNNNVIATNFSPESVPIKKLEEEIQNIDQIEIEQDDCSVYKKLTRKCHCLNRPEYNDFVIHFNEDTKFSTSTSGELIKNMRILKKFLYIGDGYTKHSLMFLNEGLTNCPISEKVEIILGCSHADLCNVFDDQSMAKVCIAWPFKYQTFGDNITQNLASRVLYRMAAIEEGRRYLSFNSKTMMNIKKVLHNNEKELDPDTAEFLRATVNLLSPNCVTNANASYYCKADEGTVNQVMNLLTNFRSYMTMDEMMKSLVLLQNLSESELGKRELGPNITTIFPLFKCLLMEFDNSNINVIITNTMRNMMKKPKDAEDNTINFNTCKALVVSDTATEPPSVKHESAQIPIRHLSKYKNLKYHKSNTRHQNTLPGKEASKRKFSNAEFLSRSSTAKRSLHNRSFAKELRSSLIVTEITNNTNDSNTNTTKSDKNQKKK